MILKHPSLDVYHDIFDKVILILSSRNHSSRKDRKSAQSIIERVEDGDRPKTSTNQKSKKDSEKRNASRPSTNSPRPVIVNKDIENVLSLVQAGSIMKRVSSSKV